jgi:flagellar biosynthesis/type III secretory pathway M-ring protein FliF/YscJ
MEYVAVLLPSLVVGLIFWFAMRAIFNADKSERQAEARAQAEADARAAQRPDGPPADRPDPESK